jgi:hypothetical protein
MKIDVWGREGERDGSTIDYRREEEEKEGKEGMGLES